jgi:hypothetical protein
MNASPPSSISPPSARPFSYTTRPEPRWTKALRGIVIARVAIVIVVALVAPGWVWLALGGVAHTATDHTVSAARSKATPIAQGDVERIVTVLAPTLASLHSARWPKGYTELSQSVASVPGVLVEYMVWYFYG